MAQGHELTVCFGGRSGDEHFVAEFGGIGYQVSRSRMVGAIQYYVVVLAKVQCVGRLKVIGMLYVGWFWVKSTSLANITSKP